VSARVRDFLAVLCMAIVLLGAAAAWANMLLKGVGSSAPGTPPAACADPSLDLSDVDGCYTYYIPLLPGL